MHEIASIISITLTFPTIMAAGTVLIRWFPEFKRISSRGGIEKTPRESLHCGIFFGFLKDFFDNLYWLVPWSLVLINSKNAHIWVMAGVYVNCFVKQGLGLISSRYHLTASEHLCSNFGYKKYKISFSKAFTIGMVFGALYVCVLAFNFYGT